MRHVSAQKPLELWFAIWEDVMSPERQGDVTISREELLPTVFQLCLTDAAFVVQNVRVRCWRELQVELVDVRQEVVEVEVAGERQDGSIGQRPKAFEIEVAPRRILWVCDAVLDGIDERRRAALEVLICPVGFQEGAFIQCEMSPGSEIQDAGAIASQYLGMSSSAREPLTFHRQYLDIPMGYSRIGLNLGVPYFRPPGLGCSIRGCGNPYRRRPRHLQFLKEERH